MEFGKLIEAIDGALSGAAGEAVEKQMTMDEFKTYCQEQVQLAKADHEGGKEELAKERLEALKGQVTELAKFNFEAGSLPSVKIFKAPEQKRPSTVAAPSGEQTPGGLVPAATNKAALAKFDSWAKALAETIATVDEKTEPSSTVAVTTETETGDDAWPEDLAKADEEIPEEFRF